MKKNILLFITIFLCTAINAQEFEVVKSAIFKDKKKHSFLSFSLDDGQGGLITIRKYLAGFPAKTVKGYYIQHFDKNLTLKKEFTYEVKKNRIEKAFIKNGKIHLIEFEKNKKEKKLIYTAKVSNLDTFDFTSKELLNISESNINNYLKLANFPLFFKYDTNERDKNHLGEVTTSKNNNFFVINFDFKDKDKETHKVFVFNHKLEMVYEKLIVKDIKDQLFKYNSIDVDDENGTLYFLGKSFENNSKRIKKDGKANYHFELNKIDANGEKTVSFKTPESFIRSLSLVKNNDKISCVGFYGNKTEHKYNGICLFTLNPNTLELESKKLSPFSESFMEDKYGDNERKKKRKKKKGIKNIVFKSLFSMSNGDLIISAEEEYITIQTTYSADGNFRTRTIHHFDDILTFRLNKDGDIKWARNINKNQTGFSNSSFTPISTENTSCFFINCSDKITKLENNRIHFRQTSSKKSNLYCIYINNDGEIDFEKLVDDKDSKVFYKVNNGTVSKNKDEVIFLGKRKKNSQIIKVKIKG